MLEHAEYLIVTAVEWLKLAVESLGALVIGLGVVLSVPGFARSLWRRQEESFDHVRLLLARYLALGLEFQLAADVLSTAIAPTWERIGKMASIAVIRTLLNFFLMREMHQKPESPQ